MIWISLVILIYSIFLARVQPYYASFSFECDFVTSVFKGILVLMYPLAAGGTFRWIYATIAYLAYAIAFIFLVVAVICNLVQRRNLRAADRDRPVIDWEIVGNTFIDKLTKALPSTMDWTEVAIHMNEERGTDFKPYSKVSYMKRRRMVSVSLSERDNVEENEREAYRGPSAQDREQGNGGEDYVGEDSPEAYREPSAQDPVQGNGGRALRSL